MDEAEQRRRIAQGHRESRCPNCWEPIEPGKGHGSGKLSHGTFCGQGCEAGLHEDYYRERIRASRPSAS